MPASDWTTSLEEAASARARGEWHAADLAYEKIFDDATEAGAAPVRVQALTGRAAIRFWRGALDEAAEHAAAAAAIAADADLAGLRGRAVNLLGLIALQRQDWGASSALLQEALECAHQARDDELVGAACMNLGSIANIRGELRDARSYYLESVGASVRCDDHGQLALAYNNLGMVCADLEGWMEALVYFDRGLEIADAAGNPRMLALLLVNQAEPLVELGEMEKALAALNRGEAQARLTDDVSLLADVARWRGRIARLRGDHQEAERFISASLACAEEAKLALHRAEALEELSLLLLAQGREDESLERLAAALELYSQIGAVHDLERARSLIERIAPAAGSAPPAHPARGPSSRRP